MILKQYYLGCLAHASYLVADEGSRTAAIVDPQRDVDQYLEDAARQGLQIRHAILTHFHADFVAGHLELARRTGAKVHVGAAGKADYAHAPMHEGDVIELGPAVRLGVLETPGHTPEGVSLLVYDIPKDPLAPQAVLTGDTLFVGDVGRPDLMASIGISASDLAGMLYESLHGKLLKLPDATVVYPAHGAGSMCGKALGKETFSTIGEQRRYNYALQPMSKEAFVALVTADQPDPPSYFSYDAALNRQERVTLEEAMAKSLKPLPLADLLASKEAGAQVLDARDPADYEGGHLRGSINVGLGGKFATWAGTVLDRARPIVIVADGGREQEAALRLGRIGFDHVTGYLEGGIQALKDRPDLVVRTERITAEALKEILSTLDAPPILDVRGPGERATSSIAGSLHVPLNHLQERLAEVPRVPRLVVHCATGYRSAIAASILEGAGHDGLMDLVGGIAAWEGAKGTSACSAST